MIRKDYEPIKFEIFQSDMEKIQYTINEAVGMLKRSLFAYEKGVGEQLEHIYQDFEHKIKIHKERGEWI